MKRQECEKIVDAFERVWDALMIRQETNEEIADILGATENAFVIGIDKSDADTLMPFLVAIVNHDVKVGNARFETQETGRFFFLKTEDKCYICGSKDDYEWRAFMIALKSVMSMLSFSYKRIKLKDLYREAVDDVL